MLIFFIPEPGEVSTSPTTCHEISPLLGLVLPVAISSLLFFIVMVVLFNVSALNNPKKEGIRRTMGCPEEYRKFKRAKSTWPRAT